MDSRRGGFGRGRRRLDLWGSIFGPAVGGSWRGGIVGEVDFGSRPWWRTRRLQAQTTDEFIDGFIDHFMLGSCRSLAFVRRRDRGGRRLGRRFVAAGPR